MSEEFSFWNNTIDDLDCEADRGPDLRCLGFTLDLLARATGGRVIMIDSGGVRVEWANDDKRVTLVVHPGNGIKYMYRGCVGEHITTRELTPTILREWLSWLKSTEKPPVPKWIDMLLKGEMKGDKSE